MGEGLNVHRTSGVFLRVLGAPAVPEFYHIKAMPLARVVLSRAGQEYRLAIGRFNASTASAATPHKTLPPSGEASLDPRG